MIGVWNQFLLSLSIGGSDLLSSVTDLSLFSICEQAGNQLPTFALNFDIDGASMNTITEQSTLDVSMGTTFDDMRHTTLYFTASKAGRHGDRRRVTSEGMLATPGYQQNTKTGCTSKKSGIEVVLGIAGQYFNVDSDVQASNDSQNWIQNSIPDKQFLQNAWLHADLQGSWPAIAISALDNTFILRSMGSAVTGTPQWKFVPTDADPNDPSEITYLGDYSVTNNSGFINSWQGYQTNNPVFNIDQGIQSLVSGAASSLMSGSDGLGQRGSAGGVDPSRSGTYRAQTANMHQNYHSAYESNTRNLALFSSFTVDLSFRGRFVPIRPLDIVMFTEDQGATPGQAEYASGLYAVSKVERFFSAYQHATRVTLTREGPGGS